MLDECVCLVMCMKHPCTYQALGAPVSFLHPSSVVVLQDAEHVRWREHVTNAHFIQWRLDKLQQRRLEIEKEKQATKAKVNAWEQRYQNQRLLSSQAYARWMESKAQQNKEYVPTRLHLKQKQKHAAGGIGVGGLDDEQLLQLLPSCDEQGSGQKGGASYINEQYCKRQQELMWDPKPLSAVEQKRFVFGEIEQQTSSGTPAWLQPQPVVIPKPK